MSAVSSQEGSWVDPASQRAFSYRIWHPAAVRQVLIIVHGFGEHSGRYQQVGQALAERGFCVAVPDLWGHGRSGGRRGDVTVAQCVRDGRLLTEQVFLPFSGQDEYALFGHSFGGLVAIQWALDGPTALRRVVTQSPLLELGFPVPGWKVQAARMLARCWPAFTFRMNLDVANLSHDPAVASIYRTDPLVHNAMSARSYVSILNARGDAVTRARAIRAPVLLLCGSDDRIVSVTAAQHWFGRLECEKRCVIFPGCYHELHHEGVCPEVLQLVQEWTLTDG